MDVTKDGRSWRIGTRSWLVSALWDDAWTDIGASGTLIAALVAP